METNIDYGYGYLEAKNNFKILFKSAKQANLNGFYGLACSLNILAVEEMIKSVMIFIQSKNLNTNVKDFEEVFHDHKKKHDVLIEFFISGYKNIGSLTFNILEGKEEFLKNVPKEYYEEYVKEYKDMEKVKRRTDKIKSSKVNVDDRIIKWLKEANNNKNYGLYINITKDKKWTSPSDIKKEKFKLEKKYTDLLVLYAKNIMDIHVFNKEAEIRMKKKIN